MYFLRNHFDRSSNFKVLWVILLVFILLSGCNSKNQDSDNKFVDNSNIDESQNSLFDGKTLGQWQISDFYNPGKVYVKDEAIHIDKSTTSGLMQGIYWTGPLETMNYEISLEAMRVEGNDFFCGLTFPVGENPCTLILGGWGGTLCGLSSIDSYDASENQTTTFYDFNPNQWYHVRLRVTPNRIQAWLDDEGIINADITDKSIDIRIECLQSLPLGIATFLTSSAIRNITLEKVDEPEDMILDSDIY